MINDGAVDELFAHVGCLIISVPTIVHALKSKKNKSLLKCRMHAVRVFVVFELFEEREDFFSLVFGDFGRLFCFV